MCCLCTLFIITVLLCLPEWESLHWHWVLTVTYFRFCLLEQKCFTCMLSVHSHCIAVFAWVGISPPTLSVDCHIFQILFVGAEVLHTHIECSLSLYCSVCLSGHLSPCIKCWLSSCQNFLSMNGISSIEVGQVYKGEKREMYKTSRLVKKYSASGGFAFDPPHQECCPRPLLLYFRQNLNFWVWCLAVTVLQILFSHVKVLQAHIECWLSLNCRFLAAHLEVLQAHIKCWLSLYCRSCLPERKHSMPTATQKRPAT